MDVDMPVMNGIEATRASARRSSATVVMVSGSDAAEDVDRARLADAAGDVTKDHLACNLGTAILAVAG